MVRMLVRIKTSLRTVTRSYSLCLYLSRTGASMKFPEINSRGLMILQAFRVKSPMTIWQGIEAHGAFASPQKPEGIEHYKILGLYCDLVERGCLAKEGIFYRLTLPALHRLQKMDTPDQCFIGEVAAPRISKIWEEPTTSDPMQHTGRYTRL